MSLTWSVIPDLIRNPVFSWIPAFAGMTAFAAIKVAVHKIQKKMGYPLGESSPKGYLFADVR